MDQNMELLSKIEENSRKQLRASRIQCLFSLIAALCCIAVLITVLQLVPMVKDFAAQAEAILSDLETATHNLAQIDLADTIESINALVATSQSGVEETLENINDLMTTSQSGVEEAMDKLNAIDFKALNTAIEDLGKIIKPLAEAIKWFG